MFLIYVAVICSIPICKSQIPKECGSNFTTKTGVCCPMSETNGRRCGYPERGECAKVENHEEEVEMYGFSDTRFHWPRQWFEYLCQCKENYFGVSCDECWYGRTGDNCSINRTIVRRDVLKYNITERRQLVNILLATRDEEGPYLLVKEAYNGVPETVVAASIHEVIVNIHFLAQRLIITPSSQSCEDVPSYDFAHASVGFVTYHRHLMMLWERWTSVVARRLYGIEDFAFPYWDWTNANTCDICTDDLIGAIGEMSPEGSSYLSSSSPFHSWKVYCDIFNPKEGFTVNPCAPCSASSQSSRLTRSVSLSMFPRTEHIMFTISRNIYGPELFGHATSSQCPYFTKALEGICKKEEWNLQHFMHNAVHSSVVGSFSEKNTSPNDPLFIFHHTQIDRIFQLWWLTHPDSSKKYPKTNSPGHCYLCNQVGFIPIVNHKRVFTDSRNLGYNYDSFVFGQK